jgi:hypothetical protein
MNRLVVRLVCSLACTCAAAAMLPIGAQASRPAPPDLVGRALARTDAASVPAPDLVDRLLQRQSGAPVEGPPVIAASAAIAREFHWRDAGIGAVSVVALALAATAGLVVVRRYRAVTQ